MDDLKNNRPLVYLACPYSDPDREVRLKRFHAANVAAGKLMTATGEHVFSPISHTHAIAEDGRLPFNFDFWASYDRAILSVCHKIYILRLDGWQTSKGVLAEMSIAVEMGIPIEFLDAPAEAPAANERKA
jgi:hypothetical protein